MSSEGTAIAPFLPHTTPPASAIWIPVHVGLFLMRSPVFFFLSVFYFGILEWLPVPTVLKKAVLWVLLAIPGVWWIDLQVDGVKRGYVQSLYGLPTSYHFSYQTVLREAS